MLSSSTFWNEGFFGAGSLICGLVCRTLLRAPHLNCSLSLTFISIVFHRLNTTKPWRTATELWKCVRKAAGLCTGRHFAWRSLGSTGRPTTAPPTVCSSAVWYRKFMLTDMRKCLTVNLNPKLVWNRSTFKMKAMDSLFFCLTLDRTNRWMSSHRSWPSTLD